MAEKLVKSFAVGTDIGKIDYESLANKPKEAFKKVTFKWTNENIKTVNIYKFCSEDQLDTPATINKGAVVYSRDGDLGFVAIDEPWREASGQVNFSVELLGDYDIVTPVVSNPSAYKNFKTPFASLNEGIYRFTKINDNFEITDLTVGKESDMEAWNVTYKLVVPEGYDGIRPTVTIYRCEDAALADYMGKVATFDDDGNFEDYTYSKESGLRDKTANDTAQLNFKVAVEGELPEGYQLTVTGNKAAYNKLEENTSVPGLWKATKVKADVEITIKVSEPFSVTYNGDAGYADSPDVVGYKFESAPLFVAEGDALDFAINYENIDTTQYRKPTSGDAEDGFNLLDTVMVGEVDIKEFVTYQEGETGPGGKKAKFRIPAEKINGNIVINAQSIEIIPAAVTYETVGFDTVSPAWQIEDGAIPSTAGIGAAFQFEVRHNAGNASFWTTDEGLAAITSITSNGVNVKDKLQCTEVSKQKFKYVLAAEGVTGDIAMTITAQTKA